MPRRAQDSGSDVQLQAGRSRARPFDAPTLLIQTLVRRSLPDRIAGEIQARIAEGEYRAGDRLPAIREIARSFGVGPPTVREALKKLEAYGVIVIRPGLGVYVHQAEPPLLAAPARTGDDPRKLLSDLLEARNPLEAHAAALAARHATASDLQRLRQVLADAAPVLEGDGSNLAGESFHRLVALACGNGVIGQCLEALAYLFPEEHRLIWAMADNRDCAHEAHLRIFAAIERRDGAAAAELMRRHVDAVREAVLQVGPAGAVA